MLAEIADPRLLAQLERRRTAKLVRELSLPLYTAQRQLKLHLEPSDWGAGYLAVRDRELPDQLLSDLHDLSPQAILRDLYRPVRAEVPIILERHEGTSPHRSAKEAIAEAKIARVRQEVPRIEPLSQLVKEEQERRRAMLDEPWQPAMPDDAPRRPVVV
jgi:hypothetical protein